MERNDPCVEFDFEENFYTTNNEDKLKRIDLNKEVRQKFKDEMNKEYRQKKKDRRNEKIRAHKDSKKKQLDNMTEEEKLIYYESNRKKYDDIEERLKSGLNSEYNIIFDLEYLYLMKLAQIKSLASQISYCYGLNKKAKQTFSYHLASYTGLIKEELDAMGGHNWYVNYYDQNIAGILDNAKFENKEVIYLSPDSQERLTEINSNTVYIIGGLVDKPVSKYRSLDKANNLGIKTAKLPLDDYMNNLVSPALNINTVIEIMSNFIETNSWEEAIGKVPKRMLDNK